MQSVIFAPLIAWPMIYVLAALAVALVALALWRGLGGWWLRALGLTALLAVLANPALQEEDRAPLSDIVILVVAAEMVAALHEHGFVLSS